MPKKPNLAEAFKVDANELQPKPELKVVETKQVSEKKAPTKRHIGGYFTNDVYTQVKILGAETGMTTQQMLAAGLNALFRMHDKPPIA